MPEEGYPKTEIRYKHLGVKAPLVDFVEVSSDVAIESNFSHTKALLRYKRSTTSCLDFFDESQKVRIMDHFRGIPKKTQDMANDAEQKGAESEAQDSGVEAAGGSSAGGGGKRRPPPPPPSDARHKCRRRSRNNTT